MLKPEQTKQSLIFAIGGGKGGIGKSVLAASMATGLAMLHQDVILIDADLGGANLHRILGMESVLKSSMHFIQKKVRYLEEMTVTHPRFANLKLIRGMNGYLGAANLPYNQKMKFIRHIHQLPSDYIVLDLGGGSDYHVLDFFLAADTGVVIVTPEPLSILEGYHFIKQVFFRKLALRFRKQHQIYEIIQKYAHDESQNRHANIGNMMTELRLMNASVAELIDDMRQHFHPALVINRLQGSRDERDCLAVKTAARELLSIQVDYWGAVRDDPIVYRSIKSSQPFISYHSKSRASRDLATILITKMLRRTHMTYHSVKEIESSDVKPENKICSIHCEYWQNCHLKNGGFPCDLITV